MIDPYAKDTPSLGESANNLYTLTPDNDADIPVGVKALRIFNNTAGVADVAIVTATGNTVTLKVPAGALIVEPLRIMRLLETTTVGVIVQGYTDFAAPVSQQF